MDPLNPQGWEWNLRSYTWILCKVNASYSIPPGSQLARTLTFPLILTLTSSTSFTSFMSLWLHSHDHCLGVGRSNRPLVQGPYQVCYPQFPPPADGHQRTSPQMQILCCSLICQMVSSPRLRVSSLTDNVRSITALLLHHYPHFLSCNPVASSYLGVPKPIIHFNSLCLCNNVTSVWEACPVPLTLWL